MANSSRRNNEEFEVAGAGANTHAVRKSKSKPSLVQQYEEGVSNPPTLTRSPAVPPPGMVSRSVAAMNGGDVREQPRVFINPAVMPAMGKPQPPGPNAYSLAHHLNGKTAINTTKRGTPRRIDKLKKGGNAVLNTGYNGLVYGKNTLKENAPKVYQGGKTLAKGTVSAAVTTAAKGGRFAYDLEQGTEKRSKKIGKSIFGDRAPNGGLRFMALAFNGAEFFCIAMYVFVCFCVFDIYPVFTADVFNSVAASFIITSMRLWTNNLNSTFTLLSIGASTLSFATNFFAYLAIKDVTFQQAVNGTVVLTSTLNRTVLDPAAADISSAYWDGLKGLHVVVLACEVVTMIFVMFMTVCTCKRRQKRRHLVDDDDWEDDEDEEEGFVERLHERDASCLACCGRWYRLECIHIPDLCPNRSYVVDNSWSESLLFAMKLTAVFGLLIIVSGLGLSLASGIEKIPAWTTLQSPNMFLVTGMLLWILPPVGETHVRYEIDEVMKTSRSIKFIVGGFVMLVGLILSTWTLVLEKLRVEPAVFVNQASYKTVLSGGTALTGGYTYVGSASDYETLTRYAMAHHVLELMLVIAGYLLFVFGTIVFVTDSGTILGDAELTEGQPIESEED